MRIAMSVTSKEIVFSDANIEVKVDKHVYQCWLNHRQLNTDDTEQFGAIVGSRIEDESVIWIEQCTTPQPDDISERYRFVMKSPYHQQFIEAEFKASHGEMGYIGTWHTHPERNPFPSIIDIMDWKQCINRNPDRQLIFVIVGNKKIKIYIDVNGTFTQLERHINE